MNKLVMPLLVGASIAAAFSPGRSELLAASNTLSINAAPAPPATPAALASALGIEFVKDSTSTVIIEREGKKYVVDLAARTVRDAGLALMPAHSASSGAASGLGFAAAQVDGAKVFKDHCAMCHGPDGKGRPEFKTPNFTDSKVQASITDAQIVETITNGRKGTAMPAWRNDLSADEIKAAAAHIRFFGGGGNAAQGGEAPSQAASGEGPHVYKPGDDFLMSLPTGRRLSRHGFYVNFTHRFIYTPAFSGVAIGGSLGGLDDFSLSSFGFRYGVTDKFSVSIYRSPTFIARPIQMMAAYNFLDERDGQPLNAAVRFSVEGHNNFNRNFTENIEGIFSRSITRRAQIYFVPTVSFNDHKLFSPNGFLSSQIPILPGYNAVSLGAGLSVDVRPTVALVAEVIPTVVNGRPLGIHRPEFSFGIQKKIWRHAFTFGFTTSPGTTVSERAATRASFLNDPKADKPSGLFIGFDLMRQMF